ncbi:MAG: tRNA 2-selenouridine(34) synthase MnmH [Phenylobacterium sp.]|uniref:tRNA 2-selenouridine(34) synthase MnmH n=1 Tax=Phenylobacterium sp. TaxID=1871053 RepID=UPI00272FA8FD|nr:tRNA 2-selenouridine(34) synthase MnmH [Phenylobacterium sp.]MDP2009834.1 tRNA 2-selenouridine(34) synthase MnmH [Phenylobacterium sp.]
MGIQLTEAVDAPSLARFDAIIDVRSPGEFAEDHVPGAENLPVLDDAERADVGTIYVQESRFLARRIGAALVARNIARHLENALADRPASFQPLIYCWRGGQRSTAMATILSQVGWPVWLLTGGYKTYRRAVNARLYDEAPALNLVLLDGHTGTAKTEILARLAGQGVQTLDLEALASHRGSLFGAVAGHPQPSQKLFESRLLAALDQLDPSRPIVVEAESSKIGERMTPPAVWKAMQTAPRIVIQAPREARARYLVEAYRDVIADRAELEEAFSRLPVYPGQKRLENWRGLADAGAFEDLAGALMEHHYDPAYDRSARKDERPRLGIVELADLGAANQEAATAEIRRLASI